MARTRAPDQRRPSSVLDRAARRQDVRPVTLCQSSQSGSIHYCAANDAAGCQMKTRFALLKTGFVALTCAVGLLSMGTAAARPGASIPSDGELRRLTLEQLHDGRYHLPLPSARKPRFDSTGGGAPSSTARARRSRCTPDW